MTIFINNKCAIKKETKPNIKNNAPSNIKKTSPKKEKIKAKMYILFLTETETAYNVINDNKINGLNN